MNRSKLNREDLLYPELSCKIIGCAFEVFNQLGPGHAEKTYHAALALSFKDKGISFNEQVYFPVKFMGKVVGRNFFDFLVDDKIIIEIKKNVRYSKVHLDQVSNYLQVSNLKLAILINFMIDGVTSKRIINISEKV
jgi:GxxExxY protein